MRSTDRLPAKSLKPEQKGAAQKAGPDMEQSASTLSPNTLSRENEVEEVEATVSLATMYEMEDNLQRKLLDRTEQIMNKMMSKLTEKIMESETRNAKLIQERLDGIHKPLVNTPQNQKPAQKGEFTEYLGNQKLPSLPSTSPGSEVNPSSRELFEEEEDLPEEVPTMADEDDIDGVLGVEPPQKRRESILERIAQAADAPRVQVTMMSKQPKYDQIRLEYLTPRAIFKFIDEVNEYQIAYGIVLPVPTLISNKIRDNLMARHRGLTLTKFYNLTTMQIIKILQRQIRPESMLAFQITLAKHSYFETPSNYKPNVSDFKPFYDALLQYKARFLRIYEIMAANNEDNIPETNNKEGGLIKIFVDKIPFEYGSRTFRALKKNKFNTIYEFLTLFFAHTKKHYETSVKAQNMQQHFGGTEYVANRSAKPIPRPFTAPHNSHRVNAMAQEISNHEENEEEQVFIDQQIEEMQHPVAIEDDSEDDAEKVAPAAELDYLNGESEEQQQYPDVPDNAAALHAFSNSAKSPNNRDDQRRSFPDRSQPSADKKLPRGCFQMLFFNTCNKGSRCSYSHDHSVLHGAFEFYTKLLAESKYKTSTPTGILRRNTPGSLSLLKDSPLTFEPQDVCKPSLLNWKEDGYLHAFPEAALFSACHRQGSIEIGDSTSIPVPKSLFDTGALHGSYISTTFVDSHIEHLRRFMIPCQASVTLADNKTVVTISNRITLTVCFIDNDGHQHRAQICFNVFDTSGNDMIIGLPNIIAHFSVLHKHMIDSAVAKFSPPPVHADISQINQAEQVAVLPWTVLPSELEAPEDMQTDLPCAFPEPLHYMEMTHEQALQEYFDLIPTQVSAEFRKSNSIEQLLRTKGSKVFVPQNWNGINGVVPLKLRWREGLPTSMKPRARPVNPKLYEHAKKEFDRLCQYFYVPSDSPIASCLVIAPKATKPFIRFCGDYVGINKYIMTGHFPIPHVQHNLGKIIKYKVFLDFDMVNSFHQIPLHPETSELLSVQTPWGQVRPLFIPEGIPPASGELQKIVTEIFADFSDWSIAIFDNLLVLAEDYADALRKVELILDRCIERNVYLKFSKTWLGFDHAKFFGYICKHGSYELAQDRKDAISAIAFPKTQKQMQSFLGAALFFKSFIPHYSSLTASLNDMVKSSFNWTDPSSWAVDYVAIFDKVKKALQDSAALFYPNYELDWVLRTDASLHGVGAVLLQVFHPTPDSEPEFQPIGFASQKFSPQASRWSTIEQAAYGIYFGVHHFAYYLHCKPFILETDHNNLLWIQASQVPKVIRWRIYLQSFSFLLRHIPGKTNLVADWLSRAVRADEPAEEPPPSAALAMLLQHLSHNLSANEMVDLTIPVDPDPRTPESLLKDVHGGRAGHLGARRTYRALCELHPGHRIPYRYVEDFVAQCPVCQKDRLGMIDSIIKPIVRVLKPPGKRSMVGVDTLKITPPDSQGNQYLTVVVNHFTKLTGLYPSQTSGAAITAQALFQYFCSYGLVDCIITDPGTEFMNEVVTHLVSWLGIKHQFSLVDRHESNGVERTNASILRHLKALVYDERVQSRWSDPTVLPIIQFMLNSAANSESGVIPFHATFGSADATYFQLPALSSEEEEVSMPPTQAYIKLLDDNLKLLFDLSKKHQDDLAATRKLDTPLDKQNSYQQGDLVLFQRDPNFPLPTKLSPKFVGPYEVIEQYKNDVTARHVILGHVKTFHLSRLKTFHGTLEAAKHIAMVDNNQFVVDSILAYRGDPMIRTTVEFEVKFADDSVVWLPWSKDLYDTQQYETFCRNRSELFPLIYDRETATKMISQLKKTPITAVQPGDTVYVDLRWYGAAWYDTLALPDKEHIHYIIEYKYTKWIGKNHLKIEATCELFDERWKLDHAFVKQYGSKTKQYWKNNKDIKFKIVDKDLLTTYPELSPKAD